MNRRLLGPSFTRKLAIAPVTVPECVLTALINTLGGWVLFLTSSSGFWHGLIQLLRTFAVAQIRIFINNQTTVRLFVTISIILRHTTHNSRFGEPPGLLLRILFRLCVLMCTVCGMNDKQLLSWTRRLL
jgi:uncharacterized membrane protein YpjA